MNKNNEKIIKAFLEKLASQDNRSTASPYFYQILEIKKNNSTGKEIERFYGRVFLTEEEAKNYIKSEDNPDLYSYVFWGKGNYLFKEFLKALFQEYKIDSGNYQMGEKK